MNVVFNIETYKIIVSLFYDEKIGIEKEKGFLDQFAWKCKICKRGWQLAKSYLIIQNLTTAMYFLIKNLDM